MRKRASPASSSARSRGAAHAIRRTPVERTLMDPSSWFCHRSHTTDDIWVCLGDGTVCSAGASDSGGAAHDHFHGTGFGLFLRLTEADETASTTDSTDEREGICYSQAEGCYYSPPSRSPEAHAIHELHRILKLIRCCKPLSNLGGELSSPSSGSSGPNMENIIERRQLQDRVASAMFIWRHLAAAKAFNSWRSVQRKKRSASSAPPGANTSSSTATPSPLSLRMHQSSRAHQLLGGRTGLRNLGNTCYLNSLFQALTHVPVLQHYYCTELVGILGGTPPERNKTPIVKVDIEDPAMLSKQLVVLFRLVCGGGHSSHTPHELVAAIWACCPQFHGFRQHDSQELLLAVLDRLQQEEKYLVEQGQTQTNVVEELFQGCALTKLRYRNSARVKSSESAFIGSITIEIRRSPTKQCTSRREALFQRKAKEKK